MMKRCLTVLIMLCLLIPSLVFAGDTLSRQQLERRLKELEALLPQIEQAYVTTQGRIAEIKNLLEMMDKKNGEVKKSDKKKGK